MKHSRSFLISIFILFFVFFAVSCRGNISKEPPIHPNINMDFQTKKKAQSMTREIPEKTVAFGYEEDIFEDKTRDQFIQEKTSFYTGKENNGSYVQKNPLKVDMQLLKRGQRQFNIYCAACHDKAGTSQSIIVKRGVGIPPPPNLSSEAILLQLDGQIFATLSYGLRNMPGYESQISVQDRWAIVSYVRAIQLSRTAGFDELPADIKKQLKSKTKIETNKIEAETNKIEAKK